MKKSTKHRKNVNFVRFYWMKMKKKRNEDDDDFENHERYAREQNSHRK